MRALITRILVLLFSAAITATTLHSIYVSIHPSISLKTTYSKAFIGPACFWINVLCDSSFRRLHWALEPIRSAAQCSNTIETTQPSELSTPPKITIQYNFALDIAGAQVIYQMTSPTHGLPLWCRLKRWWTEGEASCDHEFILPAEVIRAGDAVEGECWAFEGGSGHIAIRLSGRAKVSKVMIQQVTPFLQDKLAQAPRGISLWGLSAYDGGIPGGFVEPAHFHVRQQFPLPDDVQSTDVFVPLAQSEYDPSAEAASSNLTFRLQHPEFLEGVRVIILEVTSNWGSPSTCLSRVKIYGVQASDS